MHCRFFLPGSYPQPLKVDHVSIDSKSLLRDQRERLAPGHCALMVIDMQNDFCAQDGYVEKVVGKDAGACRDIVAPVNELISVARKFAVPVIWVAARYGIEQIPANMRAKQLQLSDAVCCAEESWGADFFGVFPADGDKVFFKHTYSAFVGTGLADYLADKNIRTLAFAGVQTNVCIENSVRDAFCAGFYCAVVEDCVASHTQTLHDATLMNTRFLYGDVLNRKSIIGHWSGVIRA